jgi:hypothetical protein
MIYNAKIALCSEIHTKHQRKVSTMWNFLMLNLVVRKKPLGFKRLSCCRPLSQPSELLHQGLR